MWSSETFDETPETARRNRAEGVWRLDQLDLPPDDLHLEPVFYEVDLEAAPVAPPPSRRNTVDKDQRMVDAFERGKAEGHALATNAERSHVQPAITALESAVARFNADRARWRGNAAGYLAAIAAAMARHIIEAEVDVHSDLVKRLAERALEQFPADEPVRVRLNPADLAVLGESAAVIGQRRDLQWMPDAAIGRGGCMIEGRVHVVDGRVDVALERMYQHMVATDA